MAALSRPRAPPNPQAAHLHPPQLLSFNPEQMTCSVVLCSHIKVFTSGFLLTLSGYICLDQVVNLRVINVNMYAKSTQLNLNYTSNRVYNDMH